MSLTSWIKQGPFLTEDQLMEFADVMAYKVKNLDEPFPDDRDELTAIVQLVVYDTWLMVSGKVRHEEWMKDPRESDSLAV